MCSGWSAAPRSRSAGTVPERTAGTVELWRYRAAGDLYLQIEAGVDQGLHAVGRIGPPGHDRDPARALNDAAGSTFGTLFRATTFGESHGAAVGVVVDGCPPRIPLAADEIQTELDRRRPGQSAITTQRHEPDWWRSSRACDEGVTLGTPIAMMVRNQDNRGGDYEEMRTKYRPSHADYTYQAKYGVRAWQGGGRASARETVGRVAAGGVARKVLASFAPQLEIVA